MLLRRRLPGPGVESRAVAESLPVDGVEEHRAVRPSALAELDALLAQPGEVDDEAAQHRYELRRRAVRELRKDATPVEYVPREPGPLPGVGGLPEIAASELDAEILWRALHHHGALLVRGLFPPDVVAEVRADLERLIEVTEASDRAALYPTPPGIHNLEVPDSPAVLERLLARVHGLGIEAVLREYFGSRLVCVAERVRLHRDKGALPWHQDAAFFQGIHGGINTWVSLTEGGGDQPGLEVVPVRLEHVVGAENGKYPTLAYGSDSISDEAIVELGAGVPPAAPRFGPGDALLFDDLTLHRTHVTGAMDEIREVLVAWFFAPDRTPQPKYPTFWTSFVY